jgi:hypothetical protein
MGARMVEREGGPSRLLQYLAPWHAAPYAEHDMRTSALTEAGRSCSRRAHAEAMHSPLLLTGHAECPRPLRFSQAIAGARAVRFTMT